MYKADSGAFLVDSDQTQRVVNHAPRQVATIWVQVSVSQTDGEGLAQFLYEDWSSRIRYPHQCFHSKLSMAFRLSFDPLQCLPEGCV